MNPAQVSVESGLAVEGILALTHGTLVLLRLTVDGLDVHQQVVPHAEATPTFFTLSGKEGKNGVVKTTFSPYTPTPPG